MHRWWAPRGSKLIIVNEILVPFQSQPCRRARFRWNGSAEGSVFERNFAKHEPRREVCFHIKFREIPAKGNCDPPIGLSSPMPNFCRQTPRFSSISRLKRTKISGSRQAGHNFPTSTSTWLYWMKLHARAAGANIFYPVFFEHSQRATPPSLNTWLRPTPPSLPLCLWPRGDPPFGRSLCRDLRIRDHWEEGSKCLVHKSPKIKQGWLNYYSHVGPTTSTQAHPSNGSHHALGSGRPGGSGACATAQQHLITPSHKARSSRHHAKRSVTACANQPCACLACTT